MRYELVQSWPQGPVDYTFRDITDVAVDADDRIYALARDPRVLIFDREGGFLESWTSESLSDRPHGITVAPDGTLFIVDEGDSSVQQYTASGKLLMTMGQPGTPSETGSDWGLPTFTERVASIATGGVPFNRPTKLAVSRSGELFVSDGYGNSRVHRFGADGTLIQSWGQPGIGPTEFHVPHHVCFDRQGRLLVADRENDRIQVFDENGKLLDEWHDVQRPAALALEPDGAIVVTELRWDPGDPVWLSGRFRGATEHARVSVLDENGTVLARPATDTEFVSPHGAAIDSQGNLYICQLAFATLKHVSQAGEPVLAIRKLSRKGG